MTHSRSMLPSSLLWCGLALCALLAATSLPLARAQALASLSSSLSTQLTPIQPAFDPATRDYSQIVANTATQISVRPELNATAAAAGARMFASWNSGEDVELQSAQDSPPFTLAVVSVNFLAITVRQTGATDEVYTLSVTRPLIVSHNANLLDLSFLTGDGNTPLSPAALVRSISPANFSSQTFGYAVQLAAGVNSFRFVATVDAQATLRFTTTRSVLSPSATFDPTAVQGLMSGAQSGTILVQQGQQQRVDVRVIAEDGYTAKNYAYVVGNSADAAPTPPTVEQHNEAVGNSSSSTGGAAAASSSSSGPQQEGNQLGAADATTSSALAVGLLALAALVAVRQ